MATATTDNQGKYSFSGLSAGRYRLTASTPSQYVKFAPGELVIDVTGDIENADFSGGLFNYPPKAPDAPQSKGGSAPFIIRGKVALGSFGLPGQTITLENLGASQGVANPDYVPDAPPSIRVIPPGLLLHKQSVQQSTCWCWAIKPKNGNWEGYCSFIRNLDLPAYSSLPGEGGAVASIPALTYKSAHGVTSSAIPTRLNLGKDGVTATVLAFDKDKLLRGFYTGAEYEVFEINYRGDLSERLVWHAGVLGTIETGDLEATIDLIAWPEFASRTLGRTYAPLCDVGRSPEFQNEEFGAGRCRNAVLNDGPLKADWTVLATVLSRVAGRERAEFSVSFGGNAVSGAGLNGAFASRLAEGKIEFLADGTGGINGGNIRDVKSGTGNGGAMNLVLHQPLAYAPMPGDKLYLTSGCQRMPESCKAYNNFANFRGFDPPGKANALRRFSG